MPTQTKASAVVPPTAQTPQNTEAQAVGAQVPAAFDKTTLPRILAAPQTASRAEVLALHRQMGNQQLQRLLARHRLQAKLKVGAAQDVYEQEADRIAAQVLAQPVPAPKITEVAQPAGKDVPALATTITPLAVATASEAQVPQAKPIAATNSFEPGADFESRLNATRGGGTPLPTPTRTFMETRFGADFSNVRLHTGPTAAQLSHAVQAQAFTHGADIYLGAGHSDLTSPGGQRLLAHELTHTLQQGAVSPQASVPTADNGLASIQRKVGFELELLVLVDINGRPPPEKSFLGRYGTEQLELQVDQNGEVEGPTPTAPAEANFRAASRLPTLANPDPRWINFGAYDLRAGYETRVGVPPGGGPVADPRQGGLGGLNFNLLRQQTWQAQTQTDRFQRPPAANNTGLDNTQLLIMDVAIRQYNQAVANWEADQAADQSAIVGTAAQLWLAANPLPPEAAWYDIPGKMRRNRAVEARTLIQTLRLEAQAHNAFWANPANQNPAPGLERLYRRAPYAGHPNPPWGARHPVAGAGGRTYASILEIVTRPYEPETPGGRAGLITAMTEATTLATEIENATGNFANRVLFNTLPDTTILEAGTYVGNTGPTRNPQSTDASIQTTFAVDLTQLGSLVKSTVAAGAPQASFSLKHQADVGASPVNPAGINRAELEMTLAVRDATRVINELKAAIGGGAPSFVNLRGLVILVCQYLRLGKYWTGPGITALDKNLTDLLSRTDLAHIYNGLVPAAEKAWLNAAPANLNYLIGRILHHTGRAPASLLLNQPTENRVVPAGSGAQFSLRSDQFVRNVFTQPNDGITAHFGGFQQRPAEDIDPLGARPGGEAHRLAPVFEMRNMIPKLGDQNRFPKNTWVPLAVYVADMIALLNARTEADATRDVRVNALNPPHTVLNAPEPAW